MFGELKNLANQHHGRSILSLFEDDPNRAAAFSARMGEMLFDYSKTHISEPVRQSLLALAASRGVMERAQQMFAGTRINETENRAVLHTALRNLDGGPVEVDGRDVMPGVLQVLDRMSVFARGSALSV